MRLGVEPGDRRAPALEPIADQAHVDLHPDRGTAFLQRDPELGEAGGDPAEEQRLGQGGARGGEVTDLVEHEVRDRGAVAGADPGGVRGDRQAQLDRLGPHRVVVVDAVDPEGVDPSVRLPLDDADVGPGIVRRPRLPGQRPVHVARDQRDLRPECLDVLEGGDGLGGRVHRDQRGDGEAVAVRPVLLGQELVVHAAQGDAFLFVVHLHQRVPEARVQHREVDPRLTRGDRDTAGATSPSRSSPPSTARATSAAAPRRRGAPPWSGPRSHASG